MEIQNIGDDMDNNQNSEKKSTSNIQDLLRPNNVDKNDTDIWNIQQQTQLVKPQTTVIETEKKPNKKKNSPISTIIILILCLATAAYGIYFMFFRTKADNPKDDEEYIEKENVKIDNDILLGWNGVYNLGGKNIVIYMYDDYTINVDIKINNSMYGFYATNENVTKDKIVFEREEFGDTISITIEKNNNNITVTASSTDKKDPLNLANGTYIKNEFEPYGWTGKYINGDTTIILNEIDANYIVTTIMKDSYVATFQFDSANATELIHNDPIDEGTIKITKTDNGINVESQSKRDGDIFNEITGTYKKS